MKRLNLKPEGGYPGSKVNHLSLVSENGKHVSQPKSNKKIKTVEFIQSIKFLFSLILGSLILKVKVLKGLDEADEEEKRELDLTYKLRGYVFGLLKGWCETDNGRESDDYDRYAITFGVYFFSRLLACCRIIRGGNIFMLDRVFNDHVIDIEYPRGSDTGELSRLTSRPFLSKIPAVKKAVVFILYRAMLHYCKPLGIRYWLAVVEEHFFKELEKVFAFERLGKSRPMYNKKGEIEGHSQAAMTDLVEAIKRVSEISWLLGKWIAGWRYRQGTYPKPFLNFRSGIRGSIANNAKIIPYTNNTDSWSINFGLNQENKRFDDIMTKVGEFFCDLPELDPKIQVCDVNLTHSKQVTITIHRCKRDQLIVKEVFNDLINSLNAHFINEQWYDWLVK